MSLRRYGMSPKVADAFDHFLTHANRGGLTRHDWERFYWFVRMAYRWRCRLWRNEIKILLDAHRFWESPDIVEAYCHCWRILSGRWSPHDASS
jgi:hypothetical protein